MLDCDSFAWDGTIDRVIGNGLELLNEPEQPGHGMPMPATRPVIRVIFLDASIENKIHVNVGINCKGIG
jgi:hypothetical protein